MQGEIAVINLSTNLSGGGGEQESKRVIERERAYMREREGDITSVCVSRERERGDPLCVSLRRHPCNLHQAFFNFIFLSPGCIGPCGSPGPQRTGGSDGGQRRQGRKERQGSQLVWCAHKACVKRVPGGLGYRGPHHTDF